MKKKKNILNIVLLVGITALVLYFALKDDFKNIINIVANAKISWLLVAVILEFGYWFFKTLAMYNLITTAKEDYSFIKAFILTIKAHFFHAITPFSSGGQPYEIYDMKKNGLTLSDATNVSIQSFIVYQIALVLLGLIAILSNKVFHIFKSVSLLKQLVLIGFSVNLFVVVLLFTLSFSKRSNKFFTKVIINWGRGLKIIKNKEKTIEKWNNYIDSFHREAKKLIKDKKKFVANIGLNFIALVSVYMIPLAVAYSLGITTLNGLLSIVCCSYVMIIGSFVPIPGGTGGLEYAFLQFFGTFVVGPSLTALMLIWRFITYYFGMILGAIVFNVERR